ncbi:MAG: hypothetical protein R3E93_08735 [Thiothrix sp.]
MNHSKITPQAGNILDKAAQLDEVQAEIANIIIEAYRRRDVALLEAIKRTRIPTPSGLADLLDDLIAKIVTRKLSPLFHQHPDTTYLICREWQRAHESRAPDWGYVAGLLDGINTHQLDLESADDLHFLAVLARFRGSMAREVQP